MNRNLEKIMGYAVIAVVLAVIGAVVGFISYSAGSASAIRSTIVETGSSLQAPLFAEWSPAYQQSHPGVLVAAASSDSGTGIADAANGLAAIGAADLPAGYSAAGLISIPVSVAGVAVVYNVPGVSSLHLNGPVLAAIYSGHITKWNDPAIAALNPGEKLPVLGIWPLNRSDSSGTTYQFTSYLQQSAGGWPAAATTQNWPASVGEQGSNAMVTGCAHLTGCIAYVGVSYTGVAESQYKLQVAALADGAGKFLLPTRANIARAVAQFARFGQTVMIGAQDGYPIVNLEYAVVQPLQTSGQAATAIRQFLDWSVTAGSADKYLASLNFEPLPANMLASSEKLISEIR